jgi:hypothetical protein
MRTAQVAVVGRSVALGGAELLRAEPLRSGVLRAAFLFVVAIVSGIVIFYLEGGDGLPTISRTWVTPLASYISRLCVGMGCLVFQCANVAVYRSNQDVGPHARASWVSWPSPAKWPPWLCALKEFQQHVMQDSCRAPTRRLCGDRPTNKSARAFAAHTMCNHPPVRPHAPYSLDLSSPLSRSTS